MREKPPIVYLIGTSTETRGGIGYVINNYINSSLGHDFSLIHIVTHCDGSKFKKAFMFFKALVKFFCLKIILGGNVVHIHSSGGPSFLRKFSFFGLALMMRCSIIFHIHSGGFSTYYSNANMLVKRMITLVLAKVDLVIVLTDTWAKIIKTISGSGAPIRVIGNPIDTRKYFPNARERDVKQQKHLLFLGAIIETKGIYDLIEATKRILHRGVDLNLTVAGNREVSKAKAMCMELAIEKNVHFPGWVPEAEKIRLLQDCDVLILPSYAEGLPLCLLEAMSCGVPIIATNVGGIPDLVVHSLNGYLFEPKDIDALTACTLQLLNDNMTIKTMRKNNVEKIMTHYSSEVIAQKVRELYIEILSTR